MLTDAILVATGHCRVTEQEAQAAYDEAPLSYVHSTNAGYTRIQDKFKVNTNY